MPKDAYKERRKTVKERVDRAPVSMAEIARNLDTEFTYSYSYVRGVLSGAPGKVSSNVLDAVEEELERIDNSEETVKV